MFSHKEMCFFLEKMKDHGISVAAPVIAGSSIAEVLCNAVPWRTNQWGITKGYPLPSPSKPYSIPEIS
jgi:hypothetical protein